MVAYACKDCSWVPPDPGATNNEKFAQLGSHHRAEHAALLEERKKAGWEKKKTGQRPSTSSPRPSDRTGVSQVTARVATKSITLPVELFYPYHVLRETHPLYTKNEVEWLMEVVAIQVQDYAEDYGLEDLVGRFLATNSPGYLPPEEDPIEDPAGEPELAGINQGVVP